MTRVLPLLLLPLASCFGGEGTLGGACERDSDCGGAQTCARAICSRCGDDIAQAGELCLDGPELTEATAHELASIAQIDMNADGVPDLVWPEAEGLAVSLSSQGGFSAATTQTFDVTGVWSGDSDGDALVELLTRDAASGATLWRPNASGELVSVGVDLEALRGLTRATLRPEFGIVAAVGSSVVRVEDDGTHRAVELADEVTHLIAIESLDSDGRPDVLAVTARRTLVGIAATDMGLESLEGHAFSDDILGLDIADVAAVMWNGDAFGDVVVLFDDGTAQVWLSDGAGAFVEGPTAGFSPEATRVLVADVTDDQQADVLGYGPAAPLRVSVRRGGELGRTSVLDDASWRWVAPMRVGADPFVDLALYDGSTFAVLRRNP